MTKEEILIDLQNCANENGIAQYTYSRDLGIKKNEMIMLKELEYEGCIFRKAVALGYAIYQVL